MSKKPLVKLIFVFALVLLCTSCGSKKVDISNVQKLSDLKDVSFNIAIMENEGVEDDVKNNFPKATTEYYNNILLGLQALETDKVDALISGRFFIEREIKDKGISDIKILDDPVRVNYCGLGLSEFTPIENYKEKVDECVQTLIDDGTIAEMKNRWFIEGNETMPDIKMSDNPAYTLKVVTYGQSKPYSYYKDNKLTGFDVELAYRVASMLNCGIELSTAEYSSMTMGLSLGKYDMISANLYITEEREENCLFSIPYSSNEISIAMKNGEENNVDTFNVEAGFKRTFIDENRYQMIFDGLCVTLLITILGFILANFVGALFCYFAMSKKKALNIIAEVFRQIMQGTPIIVLLLIMFYVVFGNSSISGVWVAILVFGLTSGSSLAILFKGSIEAVPIGQKEASLALGFNTYQTFRGIILPQAVRRMLNGYFGEMIALLKATAVVGYVAVADLTKVANIISTSTYDAFFPLIFTALVYFLITYLLLALLRRIQKSLEPKRVTSKEDNK